MGDLSARDMNNIILWVGFFPLHELYYSTERILPFYLLYSSIWENPSAI